MGSHKISHFMNFVSLKCVLYLIKTVYLISNNISTEFYDEIIHYTPDNL